MNEIRFKINQDQFIALKKFAQFGFSKNILIKTNKNKNLIFVMCDLLQSESNSFEITFPEKFENDFMFYAPKQPVKFSENARTIVLMPVIVPPIDDYNCTIKEIKKDLHWLEMRARTYYFTFRVTKLVNCLTNKKEQLK
tara:strand:- start:41 stop:457 length:417 start_codon:yes stop_codon:yes gene_type:complete